MYVILSVGNLFDHGQNLFRPMRLNYDKCCNLLDRPGRHDLEQMNIVLDDKNNKELLQQKEFPGGNQSIAQSDCVLPEAQNQCSDGQSLKAPIRFEYDNLRKAKEYPLHRV